VTPPGLPSVLRQLADYAEIRGSSLDATTWRRLAADLEQLGPPETARLQDLAKRNRLSDVQGVHPSLHRRLRDILIDGPESAIGATWAVLPWLIRRLLEFAAVDSAGAATLAKHGIVTLPDLEGALKDGRIAAHLERYQEPLQLAAVTLAIERPRVTLGRAGDLLENFILLLAAACPQIQSLVPAGDTRRFEPVVESLIVVGCAPDPPEALETIAGLPMIAAVLHRTSRRALLRYQQTELDVRIAAPDECGTALYTATGSADHLTAMRGRLPGTRLCAREEDVYAQAGIPWIAPELRHATGEIEAAAAGKLPSLITREHIRGDLHMHTTYSDGRDSLTEMVQTCSLLGYEYIAITDHSERAGAPKTVSADGLRRQRDEIARLRERFPALTILHGIEVDIMPDGRLDFADDVLETLDIVLASLHDSAGHDPARLTRRCLAAIQHPLVNVFTHPMNRLVGRHPGYDLDFPAVYEAAAATGTALEIDGAPSHLDLDGAHARDAIAAGVTVTIDSDCHRATLLDKQMRLGIGTARRGWVEPRHVLNARPLAEVKAFIAAKRAGKR
jgi:DNA polymerase (family 10)